MLIIPMKTRPPDQKVVQKVKLFVSHFIKTYRKKLANTLHTLLQANMLVLAVVRFYLLVISLPQLYPLDPELPVMRQKFSLIVIHLS